MPENPDAAWNRNKLTIYIEAIINILRMSKQVNEYYPVLLYAAGLG